MRFDLKTNATPVKSLDLLAHTASADGAAVEIAGADNFEFMVQIGAWTDGTHTVAFQESTDGGITWADVPVIAVDGTDYDATVPEDDPQPSFLDAAGKLLIVDATLDQTTILVSYHRTGKVTHIRATTTVAGATTGAVYTADVWKTSQRTVGKSPMRVSNWLADNAQ